MLSTVIRKFNLKLFFQPCTRKYSSASAEVVQKPVSIASTASLIDFHPSWKEDEDPELRAAVVRDMQVLPDFVSEAEETAILNELEPYLKRMRYEYDHWDNAIEGYRETERRKWTEENEAVIARVRAAAFVPLAGRPPGEPLPYAHVLDLAAGGHIKPHVDAVRYCGEVIAGLCLMSSAVMRLVHSSRPHLSFDALLPRRGLYIMRGTARFEFSHAVLGSAESVFRGQRVARARRLAVICRSKPPAPTDTPPQLYP